MNNIKKYREEKEMTVVELAELVGISSRHLWFIEAEKRYPSLKVAKKIANALDKEIDTIFEMMN